MITDEMVETGAKALVEAEYERNPSHKTLVSYARHDARAALEAVLPMIRAEVLEECAKVAAYGVQRAYRDFNDRKMAEGAQAMAAEILEAIEANLAIKGDGI